MSHYWQGDSCHSIICCKANNDDILMATLWSDSDSVFYSYIQTNSHVTTGPEVIIFVVVSWLAANDSKVGVMTVYVWRS